MEIFRKKLRENVITQEEYRTEAIMSTINHLKAHNHLDFVKEIGLGTYGAVLEFKDPAFKRNVAGKIILEENVTESEKNIWPLLNHKNLLPLMRVEHILQAYTYVFITQLHRVSLQEIVEGYELMKDEKGIDRCIEWLHDICSGVEHLHQETLCHLDLKMSNILISDHNSALICDFGSICRTKGPTDKYLSPLIYRPPEAFEIRGGQKPVINSYHYDIYTIGMLCLELFTKQAFSSSESLENLHLSWTEHLYPKIFKNLMKKKFEFLAKNAFMISEVRRVTLCQIRDLIRACININPPKRPSITDLMQHKVFKGDKDFKEIKNDAWIVKCDPEEVKFLVNYYVHRSVIKDIPLKNVQELLKPVDMPEEDIVDKDLIQDKRQERLTKLEQLKEESSCQVIEPELVEFQQEKTKKEIFYNWIGEKKRRFCKALYRLCCCSRNKSEKVKKEAFILVPDGRCSIHWK